MTRQTIKKRAPSQQSRDLKAYRRLVAAGYPPDATKGAAEIEAIIRKGDPSTESAYTIAARALNPRTAEKVLRALGVAPIEFHLLADVAPNYQQQLQKDDPFFNRRIGTISQTRGDWIVEATVYRTDYGPIVGGIEIRPSLDADPMPEMTSDVLRSIPVGELLGHALADRIDKADFVAKVYGHEPKVRSAEVKRLVGAGRRPLDDAIYRDVARRALELQAQGHKNPIAELARRQDTSYGGVRRQIAVARQKGFLAPARQGSRILRPGPNLQPSEGEV